jgi:hypothetical protein
MKKIITMIVLAILPFILVWVAYLLTAFSFNVVTAFQSQSFWFLSVVYWLIFTCMIGPMLDEFID